jgi:ribosome recycling factor
MEKEKISYQEIIKKIKPKYEEIIDFLRKELQSIRTSRISSSLIENVEVEYFGQKFRLKQLAAISISGTREITLSPWDNSYFEPILKTLEKKSLGGSLSVEKNVIKIIFPPLSEEFRKDLLKVLSEKKEQARQKIRKLREEAWGRIQTAFREGKISEDDKYRGKDELQDLVDEYNEKIDEICQEKEKEILEK